MTRRIALVVPALADAGGVGSVAEFVRRTIGTRADLQVRLISLTSSASDECSVSLRRPLSWFRGISTRNGVFSGEPYIHVGARFGEIETQRLKPRAELARLLRDCDLIQVVAGAPSWALPVSGLGVPVVLQVATLVSIERRRRLVSERGPLAIWRRLMTHVVSRLDDRGLRAADAVLVENPWMLAYAKDKIGPDARLRYAPPGVDVSQFCPLPRRAPSEGYILCVGRFDDPRKNIELILEAYGRLCVRLADPPALVLAGACSPGEGFWRRVDQLGLMDRVSYRERPSNQELAGLYRNAQTFALPSDEEGFGVVVIEAMASGVPVVSTRSGGPDGIITDGKDGYLVDLDDADAFAARLEQLAMDAELNTRMGRAAVSTATAKYSEQVAGQAYLAVYDELWGRLRPATAVAPSPTFTDYSSA